ncbi:Uncharacterised protein [Candidatus Bilamarchaeum dharawalense]|uniref:Carboxypeptidase regulatory-like domain protein n=1 Tax=Candidatus Bilamarchaeum dharawalense TaxID=2885759 RepID=A0A5E4LT42_9ARCH|nr:Uncharacterised protein [Candidatus Bilamarchaeum dharawalense]
MPLNENLNCPNNGLVGTNKTCTVLQEEQVCKNCDYQIVDPVGKIYTGKTDEAGTFTLPLQVNGTYRVSIIRNGQIIQSVTVDALSSTKPIENPPQVYVSQDWTFLYALPIVLLLILAVYLYWRVTKKRK